MSESDRPRQIPLVKVELEDTAYTLNNTPTAQKDFPSQILRQDTTEILYTTSQDAYIKAVDATKNEKTLKWLVYNIGEDKAENPFIILNGHMILRPHVEERYPTTLAKGDWSDDTKSADDKYPRSGNLIGSK